MVDKAEVERLRAEVDELSARMPEEKYPFASVVVQCEHHKKPHRIRKFTRGGVLARDAQWHVSAVRTAQSVREAREKNEEQTQKRAESTAPKKQTGEFDFAELLGEIQASPDAFIESPMTVDSDTREVVNRDGAPSLAQLFRPATPEEMPFPKSGLSAGQRFRRETHETHDLTCSRCAKAGRRASVSFRDEQLQEILDLLAKARTRTVTPTMMQTIFNRMKNA